MFYFGIYGFKDVKWICWGAGARIEKSNWKSILFTPIKKIIYQRFKKIGVLMPHDGRSLESDFGLKNIKLLSYFGSIDFFPYTINDINSNIENKFSKKIYLGNNSSCIITYLPLCEKLSRFREKIQINCMLNYSFNVSEISEKLKDEGTKIYGEKFTMDTTLYSLNDYYKYMNECDIYICDIEKQTGLGAIFTCLRLGKKVFLSGINYEWFETLGCTIFHTNKIDEMDNETFLNELSYQDKIKNYQIISSYLDLDKILKDWKVFLDEKV